jgi:hypothetical protein
MSIKKYSKWGDFLPDSNFEIGFHWKLENDKDEIFYDNMFKMKKNFPNKKKFLNYWDKMYDKIFKKG